MKLFYVGVILIVLGGIAVIALIWNEMIGAVQ